MEVKDKDKAEEYDRVFVVIPADKGMPQLDTGLKLLIKDLRGWFSIFFTKPVMWLNFLTIAKYFITVAAILFIIGGVQDPTQSIVGLLIESGKISAIVVSIYCFILWTIGFFFIFRPKLRALELEMIFSAAMEDSIKRWFEDIKKLDEELKNKRESKESTKEEKI